VARGLARVLTRTLGELELRLYLQRVMRVERAAALAATWRGDALALYRGPAGLAVRWRIAAADEAGARALADGLSPLAARWQREGCSEVAGAAPGHCPAAIRADGAYLVVSRGE
jgi:hypothetical protein